MGKITGNEPINKYSPEELREFYSVGGYMGLTIRQHFAAMAMQGLLANPDEVKREYYQSKIPELSNCKTPAEFLCKSSVMMADALINALNEPKP
jgi:hypothetical protein